MCLWEEKVTHNRSQVNKSDWFRSGGLLDQLWFQFFFCYLRIKIRKIIRNKSKSESFWKESGTSRNPLCLCRKPRFPKIYCMNLPWVSSLEANRIWRGRAGDLNLFLSIRKSKVLNFRQKKWWSGLIPKFIFFHTYS